MHHQDSAATHLDLLNMLAAGCRAGLPETLRISVAQYGTAVNIHAYTADDAHRWVTYWQAHDARGWREVHRYVEPHMRHEAKGEWRGKEIEIIHLTEPTVETKRELLLAQLADLDAEAVPA